MIVDSPSLLITDDDRDFRETVRGVLEPQGFRTLSAGDGEEALQKLEQEHPRKADLVKLRFFAGLTRQQAADSLGVSVATADNDWAYAKGWLKVELAGTAGPG